MNIKIALLRGINVGGKRKIRMADLKKLCESLGLEKVTTYIQSGNILFHSTKTNSSLEELLETSIAQKFGFDVPVIVRSSEELKASIEFNPFNKDNTDSNHLHLTFLKERPTEEAQNVIEAYDASTDTCKVHQKEIFIYCAGKYHQSKLSNTFFEKKLQVGATTRNWKTVLKLLALSQEK